MRLFFIPLFFLFFLPSHIFALEPQCFTEYAEFTQSGSSPLFVSTDERDDLFFTIENSLIPSRIKPLVIRWGVPYTITSDIDAVSQSTVSALIDDISTSQIEITPLQSPNWFTLTLSFTSPLVKGTFVSNINMSSQMLPTVEISENGREYVQVNQSELENYSFGFLRITFQKTAGAQSSIFLRTLRFDSRQQSTYIVTPVSPWKISVYRGWICESGRLSSLQSQRSTLGKNISISQEVQSPITLNFSSLPTTGADSDSDGIIDMRDNCSSVSNSDQKDRDHDGRWDACTDDDRDGISGSSDNCSTVRNSDQIDLNTNDIWDACEFDTDNDTVPDGIDNCIHTSNLDQSDTDSDRIGDTCDNCKIYNPDQLDLDNTTIWDVCEAADEYNRVNDTDKDGILDFSDNCSRISNADQRDTDKDSIWDVCDNCVWIKNTDQKDDNKNMKWDMCEDADADGIDGWRDNCPLISNKDQKDSNNDRRWDACSDTDYDGIYDGIDNCPLISNKDQKDIDNDKSGNLCDTKDDRYLESNKTLFMVLFGVIALLFIWGIVFFIRKIKL